MPAPAGHQPRSPFVRPAPVRLHRARLALRLHRHALPNPRVAPASDALPCQAGRLVTVPLVEPFASVYGLLGLPRLLRLLLTSRAGSCPSPFQAQSEISPGKNALLHCTTAAFTPLCLDHESFATSCPLALLGSAFYPVLVHRLAIYAPRFLPTLSHPHAVALRFVRCDQLTVGLSPTGVRPCWAHRRSSRPLAGTEGIRGAIHPGLHRHANASPQGVPPKCGGVGGDPGARPGSAPALGIARRRGRRHGGTRPKMAQRQSAVGLDLAE